MNTTKPRKPCAYCGGDASTDDHVVPRALYPPSKAKSRIQRITIDACEACNNGWSNDEPHFRNVLLVAGDPNPAVRELWEGKARRSFTYVDGLKRDCFYEYLNWYTGGFQGAFIARQGYYSAQPENARKFLTEAEWDYWYDGKPAATEIKSPFGKVMEKPGAVRDGGSIAQRLGNIAVWNSVMDEDRYLTRRWNEFLTS